MQLLGHFDFTPRKVVKKQELNVKVNKGEDLKYRSKCDYSELCFLWRKAIRKK